MLKIENFLKTNNYLTAVRINCNSNCQLEQFTFDMAGLIMGYKLYYNYTNFDTIKLLNKT